MRESTVWPYSLVGAGLILVMASAATLLVAARPAVPGKIEVKQPELSWRHPAPTDPSSRLPKQDEAACVFQIQNVGGLPVRIVGVEASCGCAKPKVEPTVIGPGGVGTVEVRTTPFPVGENLITVSLRTDSPVTELVNLRLRTFGWRHAPFLFQSKGDLMYRGDSLESEVREVFLLTVEVLGSTPRPPRIKSELPFLTFGPPQVSEKPYVDPSTVVRTYRHDVRVSSLPPSSFAGDVIVEDPWDPEYVQRIPVRGEILPPVRVSPSRIILAVDPRGDGKGASATLVVRSRFPVPEISAIGHPAGRVPLIISRAQLDQGDRFASFSISLERGETIEEGDYSVIIRTSPAVREPIVVPVRIRKGDRR